jgi:hypothetical protein
VAAIKITVKSSDDRETLHLQFDEEDRLLGHVVLDGASAEQLTHEIAGHRARLKELPAKELDIGSRVDAVFDPIWLGYGKNTDQGRLLALRHPGFGWLGFIIPDHKAAAMAKWLPEELPKKATNE